jgi:hypothetical protein
VIKMPSRREACHCACKNQYKDRKYKSCKKHKISVNLGREEISVLFNNSVDYLDYSANSR